VRLLADECLDFSVVRALRDAGHDVSAVSEIAPGEPDSEVVRRAKDEKRILLTEDRDFGQLVFAGAQQASGVGDRLVGSFVVVEPGKIRFTKTP
jgi:predicted nuclease of predicted toxin-antitoxin system